ncbi:MAG: LD-carboxypeptidase [bacterium]
MIRPPYLKKGDRVGIVSPSRSITFEEVHPTIKVLQKFGYEVVLGSHVFSRQNQFAGPDEHRKNDFQQMLDDDSIRAIICARGGYGAVRIIDNLDFSRFIRHPKWIVGYSDITVFHSHIHSCCGVETIHATMPKNIVSEIPDDSVRSMVNALCGSQIIYSAERTELSREGYAEGILTGGNLSIIYNMMGSVSELKTEGKILFLEDLDEYLYHIDRMMMNLKRAGKLSGLSGLIIGGMTQMNDNKIPFGQTAEEIISDAVAEYSYPLCFHFPAGHTEKNLALIFGRKIKLSVGKQVQIVF